MIPPLLRRFALALLLGLALVGGVAADPFEVATYADLCKVGTGTDGWFLNASYVQTADIQCPAGSNFPRIGQSPGTPFTGTYDGNGYEIRDLQMSYGDFHTGMFIVLGSTGTLQNITLVDVDASCTTSRFGALVGLSSGTISGCTVSGDLSGTTYTGGLVGMMDGGSVTNSRSSCVIASGVQSGGLIGYMTGGTVSDCHASGSVGSTGSAYAIGGLIGHTSGTPTITDSSASGTVTVGSGSHFGGLIGNGGGGSLTRCSASGVISQTGSGGWYYGGLVGYSKLAITECYASGSVTGGYFVGGLVGSVDGGQISDSYATGAVTATEDPYMAGGLAGLFSSTINTCYASGQVSAPGASAETLDTYVGGLVGYSTGSTAPSSFWDTDTSKQTRSAAGTGKTTPQMQALATFADWSIATPADHTDETWYIVEGEDYPRLAWEGLPATPPTAAGSPAFPYSQQRKETLSFLLMCWGGLAFVGVFCVVIFLLMNGAQRGSGGI